jgi:hypothetical protein
VVAAVIGYVGYTTQKYRAALFAPPPEAAPTAPPKPKMILPGTYAAKERIMVATTGNPRLIDFAIKECRNRQAELDILFIRHLAVTPMGPTAPPTLAEDEQALELFTKLREQTTAAGVPLRRVGLGRAVPPGGAPRPSAPMVRGGAGAAARRKQRGGRQTERACPRAAQQRPTGERVERGMVVGIHGMYLQRLEECSG